ncbi:hypothetical protein K4F52_004967 [Lecanicillium sp. MT-2017a]|nr:hypothetical protein K4F52_004967 [Lecanicillium sp. MT-2017a]
MKLSVGTVLACLAALSIAAPAPWRGPVNVKKPASGVDIGMYFKDQAASEAA